MVLLGNEDQSIDSVAIAGSLRAGAVCDHVGKLGSAELTSRLLSRGTRNRPAHEISQMIEELGATLQFSNYDEVVSFTGRCYSGALRDLLNIISICLKEPSFPEEEMEKARGEILAEIKAEEDETRSVAFRELLGLIYGKEAPYGRDTLGKTEDLMRLTPDDLRQFYGKNYNPSTAIFAITGNFDFDLVRGDMQRLFSDWEDFASEKLAEPGFAKSGVKTVRMAHKSQVDIALGSGAVLRSSPSYYSLSLGNLVLGRMGLYGRLGQSVREEKGLAYYSFSLLQAKLNSGYLAIMAGVNPKNVETAVEAIGREIEKITSSEISEEELANAKKNAAGSLSISLDASSERVGVMHDIEYFGLGPDYLERYPSILQSVEREDVLKVFSSTLKPESISLAVAGPISGREIKLPWKNNEYLETRTPLGTSIGGI
jgi:zinc protease